MPGEDDYFPIADIGFDGARSGFDNERSECICLGKDYCLQDSMESPPGLVIGACPGKETKFGPSNRIENPASSILSLLISATPSESAIRTGDGVSD